MGEIGNTSTSLGVSDGEGEGEGVGAGFTTIFSVTSRCN